MWKLLSVTAKSNILAFRKGPKKVKCRFRAKLIYIGLTCEAYNVIKMGKILS